MSITQLGLVLAAMAGAANERAEYYSTRGANGRPAPAAEAVAWTLRSIFMAGAQRCIDLAKEDQENGE